MLLSKQMMRKFENYHFYKICIDLYFSGFSRKKINGAALFWSNEIKDIWSNFALIDTKNADSVVKAVVSFYKRIDRKPVVFITPLSKPKNLDKTLIKNGFRKESEDSLMFYIGSKKIAIPDKLVIKRVINKKDLRVFIKVFQEAYGGKGKDEPYGKLGSGYGKAFMKRFNKKMGVSYFIAFVDNKPVGIGTLICSGKFGYVCNIGTLPSYRKQGIGAAITLNCVKNALRTKRKFIYLSTEANTYNENFYNKIGFSTKIKWQGYCLV
ncbi:MAG: GNAT family N-acetyltransferase [Candidatus Aenigmatarchaeota archaeon]